MSLLAKLPHRLPHKGNEVRVDIPRFRLAPLRRPVNDLRSTVCELGDGNITGKAALKCLYLVTRSLDPTGTGRARWVIRWKAALNAFAITFEGRINPSDN